MANLSLIAVLVFATLANAKVLPVPNGGRIVGGAKAAQGQFPYQISLRSFGSHSCGGSIINKRWIVCAAHCVDGASPSYYTVVAGSTTLNAGGKSYQVERFVVHPNWSAWTLTDDIALIKVSSDIEFNDNVQPIALSSKYVGEARAVASGWGTTSYPGSTPNDLQFIWVNTITNEECNRRHGSGSVTDTAICTYTKSGEGMCHGDSGGPLVVDGELTGIVSWGRPCAVGYPDAFTRVFPFVSWINENAVV